jgi:hypothetical protein
MEEPKQRIGRPALVAAVVFLLLLVAGIWMQAQRSPDTPPPEEVAVTNATESQPQPAMLPPPPLGRSALIDFAAAAADDYAQGRRGDAELAAIVGRRLDLRMPFGCLGPTADDQAGPMGWRYDAKAGVLRVTARIEQWTDQDWVKAIAPGAEAVEGFWITRPWIREAACPAAREPGPEVAPPPSRETLGIAQLFMPGSSRVGRRDGKPYRAVLKVPPESFSQPAGFYLVVQGRVGQFPSGAPIACRADSPDLRPVCLVATEIDRIALESADGELLAEWPS